MSTRHYDEEKDEVCKYGGYDSKFKITVKINHDGEVNRARVMPQDEFFVATKTNTGKMFIFDVSKHPSTPADPTVCSPNVILNGHTKEGYGIDWNPNDKGILVSSSDDSTICIFDIQSPTKPLINFSAHSGIVGDVEWHRHDSNVFGSVGEDCHFKIWDKRAITKSMFDVDASSSDINTISFSSYNYNLVITGGSNSILKLWDMRHIRKPLHSFEGHDGNIVQVQWCPGDEAIFSSSGEDKRVVLWDISKIGEEQTEEDAEDGVPELLFTHGGHTGSISDIAWNKNDPMTLASVSDDNILHVWQPSESILQQESLFDIVEKLKPTDITLDKKISKESESK